MRYLEVDNEPLSDDDIAQIEAGKCINCGQKPKEDGLNVVAKLQLGTIWWHKKCKKISTIDIYCLC